MKRLSAINAKNARPHGGHRQRLRRRLEVGLPTLSEADRADADGFLADMLLCLPVVGVPFFEPAQAPNRKETMLRLTQDFTFASPSNAAGVLLGRTANGRIEWKTEDGRSPKSIQDREASS
ncbi:MAG: DUF4357 domain-containing protein [Planctomycetes bacterium]|nr:DUF4357 domain-containing protein [Planctomycetota bacterium]